MENKLKLDLLSTKKMLLLQLSVVGGIKKNTCTITTTNKLLLHEVLPVNIECWGTHWYMRKQDNLFSLRPMCPVCLADSLSHLSESDVILVVLAALLQHVSGPRQPLEDAGSLPHRHLLYPSSISIANVTF